MTAKTVQSRKAKGRAFEHKVAEYFRKWFPGAERDGRSRAIDVRGTPWWVECKRQERLNVCGAVEQAVAARDYRNDTRPIIVIHQRNREGMMVYMRMEDFIRIAGLEETE